MSRSAGILPAGWKPALQCCYRDLNHAHFSLDNASVLALPNFAPQRRGDHRENITRDGRAREVLESLTHPEIFRLFEEKIAAIKSRHEDAVVVAEVPLLIELGMQDQFDVVVLVESSSDLQKSRLMARDGSSAVEAQAMLGIQMAGEKKRPYADYIVKNWGPLKEMEVAVRKIYRKITKGT